MLPIAQRMLPLKALTPARRRANKVLPSRISPEAIIPSSWCCSNRSCEAISPGIGSATLDKPRAEKRVIRSSVKPGEV